MRFTLIILTVLLNNYANKKSMQSLYPITLAFYTPGSGHSQEADIDTFCYF